MGYIAPGNGGGGGITPPAGDIGGTTADPTVVGIEGNALDGTPAPGDVMYYGSDLGWAAFSSLLDNSDVALLDAAQTFVEPQTFNSPNIGVVPVIVNGLTAQTADLQDWQVNGTKVAHISPGGLINGAQLVAGTAVTLADVNGTYSIVNAGGVPHITSVQTTPPALSAVASGATATIGNIAGSNTGATDICGVIEIVITTAVAAGAALCTVTWNAPYPTTPVVVATPGDPAMGAQVLPSGVSTTGIVVIARIPLVAQTVILNYTLN